MKTLFLDQIFLSLALLTTSRLSGTTIQVPESLASPDLVFEETQGVLAIEAEHFCKQTLTAKRAWHITTSQTAPNVKPDADPPHVAGASGGAYVEILPDTRATDKDALLSGENFSNDPGKMAVLHYKAQFHTPGRYYVWVRAYSTGAEDNGVHAGLDGQWPESGQRWQTVQKQKWAWDCRQRTEQVHTGVPMQLFLDIEKAGEHEILFSLREDGFEMDKFVLASNKEFKPEGKGPAVKVKAGQIPAPFPEVAEAAPASKNQAAKVGALAKPAASPAPAKPLTPLVQPRQPDGSGTVAISGELKQWHKVTLTLDGPFADERDNEPNPFTDCAMTVTFAHESGGPKYTVPGYFATDGNAANTSAEAGTKWRAHLSPDKPGQWTYAVSFVKGNRVAVSDAQGEALKPFHGKTGAFTIAPTDKTGRDFRAKGRLQYVNGHYLRFAGTKEYFLKAGADAPENFLAYRDFDGDFTKDGHKDNLVKDWKPHIQDWKQGDPTWQDGKGKGIIGALNYLAAKGVNAFSFLTLNIVGDDENVFPYVSYDDYVHLDVSRLEQWEIVLDHAQKLGLFLHFKTQESENQGLLDGGETGPQRKLYYRELIARFGHHLALNWNMGEEVGPWEKNPRTPPQHTLQRLAMAEYFYKNDPYRHHVVIHNGMLFDDLLGTKSRYTGVSIQYSWSAAHQKSLEWLRKSDASGRPWAVANDEQNPADMGVPPDPGYQGHSGEGIQGGKSYTLHDIRKSTLWGTLMAGGWGVEYYFGYKLPQNDLECQDFRSREKSWGYCRIALDFFSDNKIPFWEMKNADALVDNPNNDNSKYCFAKAGELYLVYLRDGGVTDLDLAGASGNFSVQWFSPRTGGPFAEGSLRSVKGGGKVSLGNPPADPQEDWLVIVRK
jgi:hypothetical protein